ncbi:MAG: ribosomal protein S18-alanine N-acetyltransferase [Desulfobacterales bacterium]|nr:ribosomal protein S18-alanine N-acetyltransferase [Desulfobacterales bacterium]
MNWQIFPMREADIDQVLDIERICFKKPWNRISFLAGLSSAWSICYVAKAANNLERGGIIAYICAQLVIDELSILKIAVTPGWRRQGVGNALLERSITTAFTNGAATAFLEVRPSNLEAMAFYQKIDFQIVGKRPNYYPETGEDALVMAKQLKEKGR